MKLWGGRFKKEPFKEFMEMSSSISYDSRLWEEDIMVSIAYGLALEKVGILTRNESTLLVSALRQLASETAAGKKFWKEEDEDIHSAVERALFEMVGEVAFKLNTGRSRNEQIVTDMRMFLRKKIVEICEGISYLCETISNKAREHLSDPMPGFTHLQHAQPVLLSFHLIAWCFMLSRDFDRLVSCYKKMNISPLGAGAIAGNSFGIDRHFLARLLGFLKPQDNAMDAVSDRDFVLHYLSHLSNLMIHLSRFSEELVIWSTPEFSFVELDESCSTGSSLMPQKKNPDSVELIRGKTGRVLGAWVQLATTLKGLPLSYNRDLQEDKELLFDATDTTLRCIRVFNEVVKTVHFKVDKMREKASDDFLLATDLADYLVLKGVSFRKAHELVGTVVKEALASGKGLKDFDIAEYKKISESFDKDIYEFLGTDQSIGYKNSFGGTAVPQVEDQLATATKIIVRQREWIQDRKNEMRNCEKSLLG